MIFVKLLRTGRSLEDLDDCRHMGREKIRFYFKNFCAHRKEIFVVLYPNLRQTVKQFDEISKSYGKRELSGCVGAVDFSQPIWNNCQLKLKAQYHPSK